MVSNEIPEDITPGRAAFEAAREFQDGRDLDGHPLLYWSELTPDIQDTWETAAIAVLKQERKRVIAPIRLM